MIPTVGRVIHYTSLGDRDGKFPSEIQAAVITKVVPRAAALEDSTEEHNFKVSLHIFYEMGDFKMVDVPFTKEKAGTEFARGKWAWPEVKR